MTSPRSLSSGFRVLVAIAITLILWASAFVSIRSAGAEISPGALALGRMLVASFILVPFVLLKGGGFPKRAAWPGIIGAGVLWYGLYMVALNWGERYVDAGTAAMIVNVGPILLALLGGWFLKEGFPLPLFVGLAVAFGGVIIIGIATSNGDASLLGILLCLVAAGGYAAGMTFQKTALASASPLQATAFGCVVGAVACVPFSGQLVSDVTTVSAGALANMIYLGVFPTAIAFSAWAYALSHMTAGKLGITTYIVPPLVVLMSWMVLSEVPPLFAMVGGALCLVGVAISRVRRSIPI